MGRNLSTLYISSSFQFLTQISGSELQDGLGNKITGSLDITASLANNATSASYASTSVSSSYSTTALSASYAATALSSSYATNALSASYAVTASYSETTAPIKTIYETVYAGENLTKTDPVYLSGSQGANPIAYKADAGNAAKSPAVYIMNETISSGATGQAIALGLIEGINLTGYDAGQEVYLAVGGGWTATRPTGSASVQVLGIVTKGGAGGKGFVFNAGEATLPNLTAGYAWVGNANGVPVAVATSSFSTSVSTGSLLVTASSTNDTITYTKGDGTTFTNVINNVSASISASYATNALSSSFATNANTATSASYATNSLSSSYAVTASYAANASTPTLNQVLTQGSSSALIPLLSNGIKMADTALTSGSLSNPTSGWDFTISAGTANNAKLTLIGTVGKGNINLEDWNIAISGSTSVSGSVTSNAGFTGSLQGTASYADNALSSSYALTASYVPGAGAAFPYTGSAVITGSLVVTGSTVIKGTLVVSPNGITNPGNLTNTTGVIIGGQDNSYTGNGSFGGIFASPASSITSANDQPVIIGGSSNTISAGNQSAIVGGVSHTYSNGDRSIILGGQNGFIDGGWSSLLGGKDNRIEGTANYCAIITGEFNKTYANNAVIIGSSNCLNQNTGAVIIGLNNFTSSADNTVFVPNLRASGSIIATGSITATTGFTGSLQGTASYATNALSSSYALTASYALNAGGTINTSSFATTGSNTFNGNQTITGSISVTSTGSFNSFVVLSQVSASLNYVDDTAAAAGGVPLGGLYRNGNAIMIRLT